MPSTGPDLCPLSRLRDALRTGDSRAAQRAADPLIDRLFTPLLAYAERLIASAARPLPIEGADLVQDAWLAALRRLASEEPPACEEHFVRLLRRTIKTRFLDHIDRRRRHNEVELDAPHRTLESDSAAAPATMVDTLIARERADSAALFGADGCLLPLVETVFLGDAALIARCGQKPKRRARHYQALVLFHLSEAAAEQEPDDFYGYELLRRYIRLLGVPDALWQPVEASVRRGGSEAERLATVNALCNTRIRDRAALSVLRYELHRLSRLGSR